MSDELAGYWHDAAQGGVETTYSSWQSKGSFAVDTPLYELVCQLQATVNDFMPPDKGKPTVKDYLMQLCFVLTTKHQKAFERIQMLVSLAGDFLIIQLHDITCKFDIICDV